MNKTSKIILWVVVLVLVVAGIWYAVGRNKGSQEAMAPQEHASTSMADQNSQAQQSVPPSSTAVTSSTDTSNTALNADLGNLDNQIGGLNSDSSNINQSLNAQ